MSIGTLVVLDTLMQLIGPYRVPRDEMEGAMIAFFGSPVLVQKLGAVSYANHKSFSASEIAGKDKVMVVKWLLAIVRESMSRPYRHC